MTAAKPKLLLLTAALLYLAAVTTPLKTCPDCGSTSVPYPLSTSATCGDQSYKIRCDNNSKLQFDSLNNSYAITSISGPTQRLVIEPSPLLPNACVAEDISHQGIQLNSSLPFNITSSNTIFYLNCSDSLLRSPLNCSDSSLCHSYINDTGGACQDAPLCCTFRTGGSSTSYMIRVRESGCSAYTSFVNLDPGLPERRWPDAGLEIQWVSPREPVCGTQSDCDAGSTCGSHTANGGEERRCYCNDGLVWDPIAGLCAENATCRDRDGCDDSKRTALIAAVASSSSISANVNSIPMLNGTNFKDWKDNVLIVLGCLDLDLAIRVERPTITDSSSAEDKKELERWDHSNRMSLMIIMRGIPEVFRGTVPDVVTTAKGFLEVIEKCFAKNDKAETSTLLASLISMRYKAKGNISEYIMEMSHLTSRLKTLDLEISEYLLVHLVLISLPAQFSQFKISYNCQKEKWTLNELISYCVQEEERLKQKKTESAHLISTSKDKKKKRKKSNEVYLDS